MSTAHVQKVSNNAMTMTRQGPQVESGARAPLTAADRCDTCGAKAWVAATVNGVELLYCGHHATKYETRLADAASRFHDERPRLIDMAHAGRAAAPVKRK